MISLLKKLLSLRAPVATDEINARLPIHLTAHVTCAGIATAMAQKKPFLVSRLGWFETYSIGYHDKHGKISEALRTKMWNTPGIFPPEFGEFEKFYSEYTLAMKSVDILGLMRCPFEKLVIARHAPGALLCELADLEPYYHPVPWSQYLEGLKVLVVHPFAESIENQYSTVRDKLFINRSILPNFHLQTLKPPQTLCGNTDGHRSWSAALQALKERIAPLEFDVAIVGCGAYGLPVSSFIKHMGRSCIHIGGATQTLFGISGGRWSGVSPMKLYMNSSWTRPSTSERPPNWEQAEEGCYW